MILGFNLLYDTVGTTPYCTTSFPRRGNAALFSIQTTHVRGGLNLHAFVQHKNREDASWSSAGGFQLRITRRALGASASSGSS